MSTATPSSPAAAPTGASPAPAVEARDLSFAYGERTALDAVSLAVPRGAIFGLLGPNGSGKSTLLSLLLGERQPASGAIRVLGEAPSPRLRACIAMVFQERTLDPLMTVDETMRLHGRIFGVPGAVATERTRSLLERLGLADRRGAATATLSGGLKRRLELARALLTSPELILLDEPTLALDPDSRERLWQHLLEANEAGATLLIATNDVHEAERYCGAIALFDAGRVVAEGTPSALKRDLRPDSVRVDWKADPSPHVETIGGWPGVGHVRVAGHTTHVTVDAASAFLAQLFGETGDAVRGVEVEASTLEDVYFQIAGRGIAPYAGTTETA